MWEILFQTFFVIFLAEIGDKSQFLMIAMSAEYRLREIVIGTASAVCVLNLLAIAVGTAIGKLLPTSLISLVAGLVFLFFALSGLLGEGGEDEPVKRTGKAIPAIFGTYFLAELGDKTQLTALALAADGGNFSFPRALAVFLGASLALIGADLLGLLAGYILGRHLPVEVFGWVSFLIFTVCGAVRLLDGVQSLLAWHPSGIWISAWITAAILIGFLILCMQAVRRQKNKKRRRQVDTGRAKSVSLQRQQQAISDV